MDKYMINEKMREAITRAAVEAGSFNALAATAGIESVTLQLLADGHMTELSAKNLKILLPYTIMYLPGNEKKAAIKFVSA